MGLFLCKNISRAWELIFSINAHTGYMNTKIDYPCSSYLVANDHLRLVTHIQILLTNNLNINNINIFVN